MEELKKEELEEVLKELPSDIRVEVVIAELIRNQYLQAKQVWVKPMGMFNRAYEKDIKDVEIRKDNFDRIRKVEFEVWREGLYDSLPVAVFHRPKNRKYNKSAKEIREENLLTDRETAAAKSFFAPFEQEFNHFRVLLEEIEQKLTAGFSGEEGVKMFAAKLWSLRTKKIEQTKLEKLLYFLPQTFDIKGNLQLIPSVMEAILGVPVEMTVNADEPEQVENADQPALGECFLGWNMVLGDNFYDGSQKITIHLGPLKGEELLDYIPDYSKQQGYLLQVLSDYLLPYEADTEIDVISAEEDRSLELNDVPYATRLGYNTYI